MLFSQVIEEQGTSPRCGSFKPTLGPNLPTSSVDSCLELAMLGFNDMFTCVSSVGREGS